MEETGHWMTKTYRSGRVGEKVKYFVPAGRSKRRKRSTEEKVLDNANTATRKAAREVNENFCPGDGWLTLEYNQERYERVLRRAAALREKDPELSAEDSIWLSADKEMSLLMRRTLYECKKRGIVLRYLYVTSDMDKDTGELVRVHHHLIVAAECVEIVKEKWGIENIGEGGLAPGQSVLWDQDDYTPLVEYMLGQVRHIPNAKSFTPSRNLIRRDTKGRRVISGAQLRVPKGCKLIYASPYTGERAGQYIRYLLPPEQWSGVRRVKDGAV